MHDTAFLRDIGLCIIAASIVGSFAHAVGIPLILAYLAAGALLGSNIGLSIIIDSHNISTVSNIGLILLMFILGLEIDVRKLLESGKSVLVGGVIQFLGCLTLGTVFFSGFDTLSASAQTLTTVSVACALSSTLIVVKILTDKMEISTLPSRLTLGVLVLQDLWAIAFIALQPNLANPEVTPLITSFAKAVCLVVLAVMAARYILPHIFRWTSRHPELLLVTALAWCFIMSGVSSNFHLSAEMGALVSGVAIASFPYHADIAAKVSSLRDFFITLFFVGLGLQMPAPTKDVLLLSGSIIAFVYASRLITVFPTLYFLRFGNRISLMTTLNLSQVSEFALVLASLSLGLGHITQDTLSSILYAFVATSFLSSLMIPSAHSIYAFLNPILSRIGLKDRIDTGEASKGETKEAPKIIMLGFFRHGSSLLQHLLNKHADPFRQQLRVIDFNPETYQKLKLLGVPCTFGDITHLDLLESVNFSEAQIIICTLSDTQLKGMTNLNLLRILKRIAPQSKIILSAETLDLARQMYSEGADYIYLPRVIGGYYLSDIIDRMTSGDAQSLRQEAQNFLKDWNEVVS